jgi:hypothetical protein
MFRRRAFTNITSAIANLSLFSAGNLIPNHLATRIAVRKQGQVALRQRGVSAKRRLPFVLFTV